jgi:hypothetical protein
VGFWLDINNDVSTKYHGVWYTIITAPNKLFGALVFEI